MDQQTRLFSEPVQVGLYKHTEKVSTLWPNVMKLHKFSTFVILANKALWVVVLQITQLACSSALVSAKRYPQVLIWSNWPAYQKYQTV